MAISILISIIGGIFLGRAMLDQPRWVRRGVPIALLLCGAILFRQAVSSLGVEAVEAGALNATGLSGLMLILLGLLSVLTMRVIGIGAELNKAQRRGRK